MVKICLGIESTAHTFGIGIVSFNGEILANERSIYRPLKGGIHPRESARHHAATALQVLTKALKTSNVPLDNIECIAIALGPGMGPCLRTGATVARALSLSLDVPLVPVNHSVAHIEIARLTTGFEDPLIVYVAGGNTMILAFSNGRYRVFGETLDLSLNNLLDSFGEDLGFKHPGIIEVEKYGLKGNKLIELPYIVKGQDVSYSGLYTAAMKVAKSGEKLENVCYSLVEHAYYMLAEVTERALAFTGKLSLVVTGGGARSKWLQRILRGVAEEHSVKFSTVPDEYAGDNGAMIAWTGILAYNCGITIPVEKSYVRPMWRVDEVDIPWRD